jgi:homogentisate 1,2-dioxygenase
MQNPTNESDRPANVAHWTREGFVGDSTSIIRPHHTPDYVSVEGLHVPHRLQIGALPLPDRDDPEALPLPFLVGRSGVQLSASAREATMPFVVCNVEADEIHFVQQGALAYDTDHGTVTGTAGDFVCIPRAVLYRVRPVQTPTLSVVLEIPGAVKLEPPGSVPAVVEQPILGPPTSPGGETTLVVKALDGITRYVKPRDPLAAVELLDGNVPVWKLNLARNLAACGGPPTPFVRSPGQDALLFNLSARPGRRRPPIHHNADYDEVIYYVGGPGVYGAISEPGTLTWTPKGIPHHGPSEDVPEGYVAWLLETHTTLRLTPAGLAAAELMEMDQFGRHPANDLVRVR